MDFAGVFSPETSFTIAAVLCSTDLAGGVVDAALSEREFASAIARFRIELVESSGLLLGRKLSEVDTRKSGGAVGVLKENFAIIGEGLNSRGDGQIQQRPDLSFVEPWIKQANVLLNDSAGGIDYENSR